MEPTTAVVELPLPLLLLKLPEACLLPPAPEVSWPTWPEYACELELEVLVFCAALKFTLPPAAMLVEPPLRRFVPSKVASPVVTIRVPPFDTMEPVTAVVEEPVAFESEYAPSAPAVGLPAASMPACAPAVSVLL
jgi:hypothetical protein